MRIWSYTALREESKSYARRGLTSINKMRIFRLVIRYESEVDKAGNALDMRSNLIVLGSRERSLRRALNGP